jgi:putative DNA primase/helicase
MGDIVSIVSTGEESALESIITAENAATPARCPIELEAVLQAIKNGEDGDAFLLIELLRNEFVYDHAAARWYRFEVNYWREDRVQEVIVKIEERLIEIYRYHAQQQRHLKAKASKEGKEQKSKNHEEIAGILDSGISSLHTLKRKKIVLQLAAFGDNSLGITGDEWDQNPWLLGFPNGIYDLKTRKFRHGRPQDYVRKVCTEEWLGEDYPAPVWEQTLLEIFNGTKTLLGFFWRLMGMALIGEVLEHIYIILWGKGRNGKGTILETIAHVLGPLAGPIRAETLLDQGRPGSSSAPTSDIMSLRGMRLVWASETDEGRKLNAGKTKYLVGGDTLVGREVYGKHEIKFAPSHTLFLLTNHLPLVPASDYAFWKRAYLLPFELSFVDKPSLPFERPRDPNLPTKLKKEGSGILAWLVRGCLEYQDRGLDAPEEVRFATREYQKRSDILGKFLEECTERNPTAKVQAGQLWDAYGLWCGQNNLQRKSRLWFSDQLSEVYGFKKDGTGRNVYYIGIELNEKWKEELDRRKAVDS